jgi:outer membrane protein
LFSDFNAQKIGVVDTNEILNKLPQYKEAEARLMHRLIPGSQNFRICSQNMKEKAAFESEKVF